MNNQTSNPTITGALIASAGVIVSLFQFFGISTSVSDVTNVIGAAAIIYGLIHQIVVHMKNAPKPTV